MSSLALPKRCVHVFQALVIIPLLVSLLACTPASREWIDWELTKGFHELNMRPSVHCYTNSYRVKGGYTSSTHCY